MKKSMIDIEKYFASLLSHNPILKQIVKYIYLRFFFIFYKKNYHHWSAYPIHAINLNKDKESFFGYYDVSPINEDGLLIYNTSDLSTHLKPSKSNRIEVCIYNIKLKKIIFSIRVKAFNWQQGSRAQWISKDMFIVNDFCDEKKVYVSKIVSIKSQKIVHEFNLPNQISYKDDYFLSINYRKLSALNSDYGYFNLPKLNNKELMDYTNDGIQKVNYSSKNVSKIISMEEIINKDYKKHFRNAYHTINHLSISPNGKKFIFIHRYYLKQKRYDRLLLSNTDGNDLKILANEEIVSHFYWKDDKTIISYLKHNNQLGYWDINIKENIFKKINLENMANVDGHPTGNHNIMITDTYPDKSSMQSLILYDFVTRKTKLIGKFFHGFKYKNDCRCDLHPRYIHKENLICFDSVFEGKRDIYLMDLKNR